MFDVAIVSRKTRSIEIRREKTAKPGRSNANCNAKLSSTRSDGHMGHLDPPEEHGAVVHGDVRVGAKGD